MVASASSLGCAGGAGKVASPGDDQPSSSSETSAQQRQPAAVTSAVATSDESSPPLPEADVASASEPQSLPLPLGTKVLHVGDSFAGALGLPLSKDFEEAGIRSILKHTDASYLTTWAWEKNLQDYLWKFNPDLVIVTLGANELAIVEPEQRERAVKKIVATIGDRPCVWVAIPLWDGKHNGLMDVIERSVSPCVFMDTNQLIDVAKMPRISDGIHPTTEARVEWADFVFNWLKAHRIGGEKPWTLRP